MSAAIPAARMGLDVPPELETQQHRVDRCARNSGARGENVNASGFEAERI
jgi:hypothetical protein